MENPRSPAPRLLAWRKSARTLAREVNDTASRRGPGVEELVGRTPALGKGGTQREVAGEAGGSSGIVGEEEEESRSGYKYAAPPAPNVHLRTRQKQTGCASLHETSTMFRLFGPVFTRLNVRDYTLFLFLPGYCGYYSEVGQLRPKFVYTIKLDISYTSIIIRKDSTHCLRNFTLLFLTRSDSDSPQQSTFPFFFSIYEKYP